MSKKKDPDSWKGRGEAYKNAKRAPFEDAGMPHVKKKKKTKKWKRHKHEYVPAIYHYTYISDFGDKKKHNFTTYGSHCKYCGRIMDMSSGFWTTEEKIKQFKEEYPEYQEITLSDSWSYFKDNLIPVD